MLVHAARWDLLTSVTDSQLLLARAVLAEPLSVKRRLYPHVPFVFGGWEVLTFLPLISLLVLL